MGDQARRRLSVIIRRKPRHFIPRDSCRPGLESDTGFWLLPTGSTRLARGMFVRHLKTGSGKPYNEA